MQSILQYRRLRRDVQEDLAKGQAASRLTRLRSTTGTPTSEPENEKDLSGSDAKALSMDSIPLVDGVTVSRPNESDGKVEFLVGWKENDPSNPQLWSLSKKWTATVTCCVIGISLTIPTSVEGSVQDAFNEYYGVNSMAGSMTTGD